jgi:N-acetylglucosaminyl-diphospho-decaprenol L-rhamnosyltransferase
MSKSAQGMQNTGSALVTLSVVSHGDAVKIVQLMESLHRHEQVGQFQLIITDNLGWNVPDIENSGCQSLSIIRNQKMVGFAKNHNQAFKLATGRYFCVLNPDVVLEQSVFPTLVKLIKNKQADIVAPLIVDANASPQDSFRDFPTPFEIIRRRLPGYHYVPPSPDSSGLVRPDWIAGIFMLMSREIFDRIQGFNEIYRLYFEDVDFCARAQLAGVKLIVDTNVRIRHDAHRASRKELIYLLWHIQSAIKFFVSPTYKRALQSSRESEF